MENSRSRVRNRYIKRRITALVGLFLLIGIVGSFFLNKGNDTKAKPEANVEAPTDDKKEEIPKKEPVKLVGTNEEGKKYGYDANIVGEKLKNYDYTNNGEKVVFLTFDDGASTTVTPKILKTLKDNDVKATFFVTGKTIDGGGQKAKDLVKQAFDEGNAIANHSWSHDYKTLYPGRSLNLEAFNDDFAKTDNLLKEIIGDNFSTRVLRCPGGHMSWKNMGVLDEYLASNNKVSIDWNALNADAEGAKKNAQGLLNKAIASSKDKEMVVLLMHDTYGKEETAKALPQIIKYYKDNGYTFKTLI